MQRPAVTAPPRTASCRTSVKSRPLLHDFLILSAQVARLQSRAS